MKTIYKYIIIGITSFNLISCSDFLTEDNKSGLTADTFYKTAVGAESVTKACYTPLRFWFGKDQAVSLTEIGTDIFTGGNGCSEPELQYYNNSLQGTSSAIGFHWERFYSALNTCNTALSRIPESALDTDLKKVRMGEVSFLRAFYLWHIVEIWGGVHLSTEEIQVPMSVAHRSSVEDFYKQIKTDLEFAVNNLPSSTSEYGRVTKGAAEAFSARIYLYTKEYDKALQLAQNVITNYDYKLANKYWDLIDMSTCNTQKESVFVTNYTSNNLYNKSIIEGPDGNDMTIRDGGNNMHMLWVMVYDQSLDKNGKKPVTRSIEYGRPFNRYMPTLFFLNLFDETKDSRYDDIIQQVWICNNKTNLINIGDTAIWFTKKSIPQSFKDSHNYIIYDRDYVYNNDGSVKTRNWGVTFRKFYDPTRPNTNYMSSSRDGQVIRLAEMYLIAAEAEMYLNHSDKAAEYINVIRRRAAKPGKQSEMEISAKDVNIDFILDERAREFAGEQFRWFDLKRTGKLLERVKLHNPDAAVNITTNHLVRPIPQSQLDAVTNKDEFKQNEGYN